jgi:hypothetical protein
VEIGKQVQHHGPDRNIERGGRLVEDQERPLERGGPADADPRLLPRRADAEKGRAAVGAARRVRKLLAAAAEGRAPKAAETPERVA